MPEPISFAKENRVMAKYDPQYKWSESTRKENSPIAKLWFSEAPIFSLLRYKTAPPEYQQWFQYEQSPEDIGKVDLGVILDFPVKLCLDSGLVRVGCLELTIERWQQVWRHELGVALRRRRYFDYDLQSWQHPVEKLTEKAKAALEDYNAKRTKTND